MTGLAIDLRPQLLPVRNQARRSSCLAFATSTAHEAKVTAGEHLCVEYLFYQAITRMPGQDPKLGSTVAAVAAALADDGQPVETAWPYTADPVMPWSPPAIAPPFHKASLSPGKLDFDGVVAALDAGAPVVLGLIITDAFYVPRPSGRVVDVTPDIERGGHAVLAVGHGKDPIDSADTLLIRNSWGDGWGLGGHGRLCRAYVARQLHETALLI